MSTIFFEVDELTNVILVACASATVSKVGVAERAKRLHAAAESAAKYSIDNCKAYNERYRERAKPVTLAALLSSLLATPGIEEATGSRAHAEGFLKLATYNLDDHQTPRANKAVRVLRELCGYGQRVAA